MALPASFPPRYDDGRRAMYLSLWQPIVLYGLLASATTTPSRTVAKRAANPPNASFVSTADGGFQVNGSAFKFIGTNAYWLHTLNTDDDISNTLANISAAGIKVVRAWAFNDVDVIPVNGTWFQLIVNGTTSVNTGANGLQRLDTLVKLAEQHGIYLHLSLTNNWNPLPLVDNNTVSGSTFGRRDVTKGTNNTLPRNFLSNDYGGMDVYVRQFGVNRLHDEFYTNQTILNAFLNYTTQVVTRYVNSPAIFGWELANDPRCNSSIASSSSCNPQVITQWHSTVAQHIQSIDPNHLISSGNQGFFCTGCPKLFPRVVPPPPQVSPAPGVRRRSLPEPLTRERLLKERRASQKRNRELKKRSGETVEGGIRIRGRWVSTPTRRQQEDNGIGSAFDGSEGVDSEDIINIPQIGFGTFQLFPDQNSYGPDDPNLPALNNTINTGIDWIQRHAESGQTFGKPVSLTGFGLVTQNNAPDFVPFNSSVAPFGPDAAIPAAPNQQQPFGVTDPQRDDAYQQWLNSGIQSGLNGMIQYQWSQGNLTTSPGTTISPNTNTSQSSPNQAQSGQSPNDGYNIAGTGQDAVQGVLTDAAQAIGRDA